MGRMDPPSSEQIVNNSAKTNFLMVNRFKRFHPQDETRIDWLRIGFSVPQRSFARPSSQPMRFCSLTNTLDADEAHLTIRISPNKSQRVDEGTNKKKGSL